MVQVFIESPIIFHYLVWLHFNKAREGTIHKPTVSSSQDQCYPGSTILADSDCLQIGILPVCLHPGTSVEASGVYVLVNMEETLHKIASCMQSAYHTFNVQQSELMHSILRKSFRHNS